ncbi:MAG: glycosyltransferase family 4 protein [Thermodesulfobacteriota bacterium]
MNRFLKRMMRFPMRRLYRRAGVVIAVSRNTEELLESIGVPASKISVIYNGFG